MIQYEVFNDGTFALGDPTQVGFSVYTRHQDPGGMHGEQLRVWWYHTEEADLALCALDGFATAHPELQFYLVVGSQEHAERDLVDAMAGGGGKLPNAIVQTYELPYEPGDES